VHCAPSGVPDDGSIRSSGKYEMSEILSETKRQSTKQLATTCAGLRRHSGIQAMSCIPQDIKVHKATGSDKLIELHRETINDKKMSLRRYEKERRKNYNL
jgi:hypothetical protein